MADVYLKNVLPVSGEVGDLKVGGDVTLEAFQAAGNNGLALVLNAGKLELASAPFLTSSDVSGYLTEADVQATSETNPIVDSARIGTALGEVEIGEDGIRLKGQAIVYDDLLVNALDFDSGGWLGTYIEKNLEDNTVDFYSNGDIADKDKRAAFNVQLIHKVVEGVNSFFRMHWHWLQSDSTERTLTVQYRKLKKPAAVGDAGVPISSWSTPETVTMNATNNFYTYSSGTIHQITEFSAIDISDMLISDIIQFRIAREDSLSGDLQTLYFDAHAAMDSEGSRWKWVKD